jgi:hypothetical protein
MTRSEERTQFLKDIIIVAVEGGTGYWAMCKDYQPDYGSVDLIEEDYYVVDAEAKDLPWQTINMDSIEEGLAKIRDPEFQINHELRSMILEASDENDPCDIDAEGADVIVQAAMLGDIVYG